MLFCKLTRCLWFVNNQTCFTVCALWRCSNARLNIGTKLLYFFFVYSKVENNKYCCCNT